MNNRTRAPHPYCRPGFLATALCVLLTLVGCSGAKVALPPITVTFPVAEEAAFGPGKDLPPGTPLNGFTLVDGLTCNLPTEKMILDAVRGEVGGVAASFVSIDKVTLDHVAIGATKGNFRTLTGIFLGFVTVGTDGVVPLPLGAAASPEGWGQAFEIVPSWEVDLLPILSQSKPACGAAIITLTGTAPEQDVKARVNLQVTAYLEAGI